MLNELYDIAKSLKAAGINTVRLDKRIQGPKAEEKLCIELAVDGSITGIRLIAEDVIEKSWTIANGNKNSFPFVRLQDSLLVHNYNEEELKDLKGANLVDAVELLTNDADRFEVRVIELSDWDKYRERIESRKTKLDAIADEMQIVPETHERFLQLSDDFAKFSNDLIQSLLDSLTKNPTEEFAKIVFALFLKGKVQVCFEAEIEDSEYSIIDPLLKLPVSECLSEPKEQKPTDLSEDELKCAISNRHGALNNSAFPNPRLPVMGPTILFARKKDVQCRHRYRKKGVDSITVGKETISEMQAGVVAICSEENEGKTWAKIPSENPSSPDLLIAYVESALDVPIAGALNGDKLDESTFVQKTRMITEAVQGRQLDQKKESRLRLLVIRKVDTANRKFVYSGSEPVDQFLSSCDRWVKTFEEMPPIQIIPVVQGKPAKQQIPTVISPANFIVLSKERFKENGTKKDEVPGGRFFDVLQLLLGTDRNREVAARRWLEMLLPRRRQLLIGIAEARLRLFDDYKKYDSWGALSTVSAFHLLLSNLGRNGELYMRESAYKLGQLLAAADELHSGYCHDVRKGLLPSQLMGNALVAMAERNPLQALNVLCRKWPIYQAWAKKSDFRVDEKYVGDTGKLSKNEKAEKDRQWSIANGRAAAFKAAPLASELAEKLPNRTTQEFRAELILGYIAGLRTEPKNQN